jgi:hypothetical protein
MQPAIFTLQSKTLAEHLSLISFQATTAATTFEALGVTISSLETVALIGFTAVVAMTQSMVEKVLTIFCTMEIVRITRLFEKVALATQRSNGLDREMVKVLIP